MESAYNVLIMIAKNNEMISFMMSYDLNTLIYSNLNSEYNFIIFLLTLVSVVSIVTDHSELDDKIFVVVSKLYENYEVIEQDVRIKVNEIVNIIYERNKELLNKYSNDTLISQFV